MALLTPNTTYNLNGVTVKEKIIPDGIRWKDAAKAVKAGFPANALYKKQQKLFGGTGKAQSVTIHNTNDLVNVNDDSEQYTRATYNENMGSARVHFYVDDLGAWQNLKAGTGLITSDPIGSAEVGWHAGDGSVTDGGNMTSLAMEIIMGESADHDAKAKDNGARIAAWLLWRHGLTVDKLVSHTYWVNKSAGKLFSDVDEQCTNMIYGAKWCPTYIFASNNHATAKKNWLAFKALVQGYLDALNGGKTTPETTPETTPKTTTGTPIAPTTTSSIKVGAKVTVNKGAKSYKGENLAAFVYNNIYDVQQVIADRVVIGLQGQVTAAVNIADLTLTQTVSGATSPQPSYSVYTVKAGDSLWSIASTLLGKGTRYTEIKQLNGLTSDLIRAGDTLKIPQK